MQKYICTHRGTDLKTHMKKHMGKHICTHTQMYSDIRKEHVKSHMCAETQVNSQTQACTRRQAYTEPHPHRLIKRWLVQMYAETYIQIYTHTDIPYRCTDRCWDPQTHTWTNTEHTDTRRSMHAHWPVHADKEMCTHISRAQHTFTHRHLHRHVCIVIHMRANTHAYLRGMHKHRDRGTLCTQAYKVPMHMESLHAHSNINTYTWTHRCTHPVIPRNLLLCRQTYCRCTHSAPIDMQMLIQTHACKQRQMNTEACTYDIEGPRHR